MRDAQAAFSCTACHNQGGAALPLGHRQAAQGGTAATAGSARVRREAAGLLAPPRQDLR